MSTEATLVDIDSSFNSSVGHSQLSDTNDNGLAGAAHAGFLAACSESETSALLNDDLELPVPKDVAVLEDQENDSAPADAIIDSRNNVADTAAMTSAHAVVSTESDSCLASKALIYEVGGASCTDTSGTFDDKTKTKAPTLQCIDHDSHQTLSATVDTKNLTCYSSTCTASCSCYSYVCCRKQLPTIPDAGKDATSVEMPTQVSSGSVSPNLSRCYSPRCQTEQTCYSFLCQLQNSSPNHNALPEVEAQESSGATSRPEDQCEIGASMLLARCYSPRCTSDRPCYSFLCRLANPPSVSTFSLLPAQCYSPRCVPGKPCYAYTCPHRSLADDTSQQAISDLQLEEQQTQEDSSTNVESSWTASYSVTNQPGVPRQEVQNVLDDDEQTTSESSGLQTPVLQVEGRDILPTVATEDATTQTVSPWTASHSVTSQSGSSRTEIDTELPVSEMAEDKPQDQLSTPVLRLEGEDIPAEEGAPEEAPQPALWTQSYAVTSQPGSPKVPTQDFPEVGTVPEDGSTHPTTESRTAAPARTWSPSYSVTIQPGGVTQSLANDVAENLDATNTAPVEEDAPQMSVASEVAQPQPTRPWTPSYSVSRQPSVDSGNTEEVGVAQSTVAPAIHLTPTEESSNVPETPVERPWTPSYSVTEQRGSPRPQEPIASHEPEAGPNSLEMPQRPWTPSYSVTEQRGSPRPQEPALEEPEVKPNSFETQERPWTPSYSVSTQGPPSVGPVDMVDKYGPSILAPVPRIITGSLLTESRHDTTDSAVSTTVERPWSPSYAVIHQPGSPLVEEPNVEATAEIPELGEQQQRPWTPSYSVVNQPGSPRVKEPEAGPNEKQDESAPPRPWTPSYSVTRQGSVSPHPPAPMVGSEDGVEPSTNDIPLVTEQTQGLVERPWTPSYSVRTQPGSPRVEPVVEIPGIPSSPSPCTLSSSVSNQEALPVQNVSPPEDNVTTPVLQVEGQPLDDAVERPEEASKSSWTPSYSVTTQSGSPRSVPKDIPKDDGDHASSQEPPARPWTPSYSVHRQGSVSNDEHDSDSESMKTADEEPYSDPSTPILDVEQLQSDQKGISLAARYFPAWASASRVDVKTEPKATESPSRSKNEHDVPASKKSSGCFIM